MDKSLSLKKSDPQNKRVDGAEAFLTGLVDTGGAGTFSVAGFGSTVTPIETFTLPSEQTKAFAAIEAFRSPPTDRNTDYVLAMLKAVDYFIESTAPQECRTLMWFTDGAYDIELATPEFVGAYTTLSDPAKIMENFAAAVCGPDVPSEFLLTKPLAEQIAFNFEVRLIDLRGTSTNAKRDATDQVLNRLFGDDPANPCGDITGDRIPIEDADGLVEAFFNEAQQQTARTAIDCATLQGGLAASVVRSLAVLAKPSTAPVTIQIGEEVKQTGAAPQYSLTDDDRRRAAPLSVSTPGGEELASCFIDVAAQIEAIGEPRLYEGAETTPVYFAVGGPRVGSVPLAGVGDDTVELFAKVDDREYPIDWDGAAKRWVTELPEPADGAKPLQLEVVGNFVGPLAGAGQLSELSIKIPVEDVPAIPQVTWEGATNLEGTVSRDGVLVISPSTTADTGVVCFEFTGLPAELVAIGTNAVVGRIEADEEKVCGSAAKELRLPTRTVIEQSVNATGTATVSFTATFTPVDDSLKKMGASTVTLPEFNLARPIDSSRRVQVAAALSAASAVLTYLLMLAFTAWQAKLRDPAEMLLLSTSVVQDPSTKRMSRSNSDQPIRLSDLHQVVGSRTRYELGNGIVLRRKLSLNPFGRLSAVLRSDHQMLAAHPGSGPVSSDHRRAPVPLRFGSMVVVTASPDGQRRALALVPIGTSPSSTVTIIEEGLRRLDGQVRNMTDGTQAPHGEQSATGVPGAAAPRAAPAREERTRDDSQNDGDFAAPPPPAAPEAPHTDSPGTSPARRPPPPPHRR